ncbi:hypothetical protein KACC15558_20550 [Brevibacterium ammoniilyticum]|uniref:Uncharacterized protein n=1 Tax=Brevibacterium ammoniilyticum TaxID=1046555 RepID=A0ABP9U6U2_9MICO
MAVAVQMVRVELHMVRFAGTDSLRWCFRRGGSQSDGVGRLECLPEIRAWAIGPVAASVPSSSRQLGVPGIPTDLLPPAARPWNAGDDRGSLRRPFGRIDEPGCRRATNAEVG